MIRIESFESRWKEVADEGVSEEIIGLLRDFYNEFSRDSVKLTAVKQALIALLQFLTIEEGRNEANFEAADNFICLLTAEREELFSRLPDSYRDLLDDVGIDLHDSFLDPESAERYAATADTMLRRAQALST